MSSNRKFRKVRKGKISGNATRGYKINFGDFAVKSLEPHRITARQIEAARRTLSRHFRRACKIWKRIVPTVPVSKKPQDVRMGKGKGSIEYYVAKVKPGTIIFEWKGVNKEKSIEAFKKVSAKLPVKLSLVTSSTFVDYSS